MKEVLDLINQLIEMEKVRDLEFKKMKYSRHECQETTGESSMAFHLTALKELIVLKLEERHYPNLTPNYFED